MGGMKHPQMEGLLYIIHLPTLSVTSNMDCLEVRLLVFVDDGNLTLTGMTTIHHMKKYMICCNCLCVAYQ